MQRTLLSSRFTFLYKYVLPLLFIGSSIWLLGYAVGAVGDHHLAQLPKGFGAFLFIFSTVGLLLHGWLAINTFRVEVDAENFYVSNFGKETVIPRADLFEATEMRWFKPYWITLHLRRPSEFGERIIFIPQWRMGAFWTANPLVDELNASRTKW